jgi:RNA polymerase sigma-70 factor (ECF subfamily)
MTRVIAGEIDKLGILYEKYKKPLYAYFFRLTGGDSHTSEDLVHNVFYRVIRYKTSFRGQGSFASWLFRIAHNSGIDYNKKNRYPENTRVDVNAIRAVTDENSGPEKEEQVATLRKAMDKLSYVERELIILGKINCLRYREIAEILNITESNVKVRIFRTLGKLKDIYIKLENMEYGKAGSE